MTLFEMQKYVLALNDGQRLTVLIGIINHFKLTETLSRLGLEQFIKICQPAKKPEQRR